MNNFCRFLSNGYSFEANNNRLNIKPCCWFRGPEGVDEYNKVRNKWISINSWQKECSTCKILEDAGQTSFQIGRAHV